MGARTGVSNIYEEMLKFTRESNLTDSKMIAQQFLREVVWPAINRVSRGFSGGHLHNNVTYLRKIPPKLRRYYNVGRQHDAFDTLPKCIDRHMCRLSYR